MKRINKNIILTFFLAIVIAFANAQTDSTNNISLKKNSYLLSLDYGNNKTFLGKQDTVARPYLSPSFIFTTKNNFFIYASAYLLEKRIDQTDISFGKDFELKKNAKIGISYTHSFYEKNSTQPSSFIPNNINFYFKKKLPWITTKLSLDRNWGKDTLPYLETFNGRNTIVYKLTKIKDFAVSCRLYHTFYIDRLHIFKKENEEFSLTPKFRIDAGTQHFYIAYYKVYRPSDFNRTDVKRLLDVSKFNIINYDLSLAITYSLNNWMFEQVSHYCIPQSEPKIQDQKPYMFFTFNISYEF